MKLEDITDFHHIGILLGKDYPPERYPKVIFLRDGEQFTGSLYADLSLDQESMRADTQQDLTKKIYKKAKEFGIPIKVFSFIHDQELLDWIQDQPRGLVEVTSKTDIDHES